ncbi:MAG: putative baseplate assembly protein, partial [Ilumatobacteraceae bacterium]
MTLPTPNLDDRKFQDLVDEAKRMIPSLCPEWTNHNLSDPGVALIEIFAWMSEQVLYRLNQVPERMYVDFLNLVGVKPFPASAATARITFWLSAVPEEAVVVPART